MQMKLNHSKYVRLNPFLLQVLSSEFALVSNIIRETKEISNIKITKAVIPNSPWIKYDTEKHSI